MSAPKSCEGGIALLVFAAFVALFWAAVASLVFDISVRAMAERLWGWATETREHLLIAILTPGSVYGVARLLCNLLGRQSASVEAKR